MRKASTVQSGRKINEGVKKMKYYSLTIAVDQEDGAQMNFFNFIRTMCAKKEPIKIRPKHTMNYETDVLFFSNTQDESYKRLMDVALNHGDMVLNVTSVNSVGAIRDSVNKANSMIKKLQDSIDTIDAAVYKLCDPDLLEQPSKNDDKGSPVESITIEVPDKPEAEETEVPASDPEPAAETKDTEPADESKQEPTNEEPEEESEPISETESQEEQDESDDEDEYEPEDPVSEMDDDLDMNDSEPEDFEEEPEVKKIPAGKLFPDDYEDLMTYEEYKKGDKQDIIKAQVGWEASTNQPLEDRTYWRNKDFISYSIYVEKYPQMNSVDTPAYWVKSYTDYIESTGVYTGYNTDRGGFYTFDSFIRAKLNKDIPCEEMIRVKIENLYK